MKCARRACGVAATLISIFVLSGASAQTTAFDGVYAGVSITGVGVSRCGPFGPVPSPLIISNGSVRWKSIRGEWRGTVSPEGYITARSEKADVLSGKVVDRKITGSVSAAAGIACTLQFVWQKK
jgi:hypothetical protein